MGDVAKALRCTKATARVHVHLARKSLRELISKEYPELLEGHYEVRGNQTGNRKAS